MTHSGEMATRFLEYVMMQSRQAGMFLGRIPHPQTGEPMVQLETARLLIDQLEMIREKTRGNLSNQEMRVLNEVLEDLGAAYAEARKAQGGGVIS